MNKKENTILIEVATDVKWIKSQREKDAVWLQKSLDKIEAHLKGLNDAVAEHSIGIAVNKRTIGLFWKIGVGGGIALVLKLLNVY